MLPCLETQKKVYQGELLKLMSAVSYSLKERVSGIANLAVRWCGESVDPEEFQWGDRDKRAGDSGPMGTPEEAECSLNAPQAHDLQVCLNISCDVIPPRLTKQDSKVSTTAITSKDLGTWCLLFSRVWHRVPKLSQYWGNISLQLPAQGDLNFSMVCLAN